MYTITTTLDPDEVAMHIQSFMNRGGKSQWMLTHKDDHTLTFTKTEKPSVLTFIVLLMLFILPAILYLIFAWNKQSCSFFLKKVEKGTRIMVDAGRGSKGKGIALLRHLAPYDASLADVPGVKLSFWESNTPLYFFFGTLAVVLVMIGIVAILPR